MKKFMNEITKESLSENELLHLIAVDKVCEIFLPSICSYGLSCDQGSPGCSMTPEVHGLMP